MAVAEISTVVPAPVAPTPAIAGKGDPEYAKRLAGSDNKEKSAFYNEDITPKLTAKTRQILEEYSGIPSDEVIPHIHAVRDKAWALRAYPCIGSGIYLDPALPKHPRYQDVLARLKQDHGLRLLEVGSFMGSDLRSLAADGAPSTSLIATDVVSFWDIGFDMFRDHAKFRPQFVEADLVDTEGPLRNFHGSIDIVHISKVLHQWSFDKQVEACHRLVELSRVGTQIIGDQMGGEEGHELKPYPDLPGLWMHDPASWHRMWQRVERETNTRWTVETWVKSIEEMEWDRKDYQYLRGDANVLIFAMTRTE